MIPSEIERLLPKVQKPARYCGGEINTIIKDKSKVSTRSVRGGHEPPGDEALLFRL